MSLDQQGETNGNYKPPNLIREEVLRLHSRRDQIGNEIKEYQDILRSQGVGMNDPLVDAEGFPRNDIDINQVRHARNRIINLTNDARAIMKQIEDRLPDYFASQNH